MRADTTRDSFRRDQHFRAVVQQQGRVALDAEWNEQGSIDDHLRHTALQDILGDAAGPLGQSAFKISATGAAVSIGPGRYYVGGVLVEQDSPATVTSQPDLPSGASPYLDATPTAVALAGGTVLASPTAGTYVAELDVWTRTVTAFDDPELREIAVGVPDTTARLQTVWQVRLVRVGNQNLNVACGDPVARWQDLRGETDGRMRAWAEVGDDTTTPCEVPAGAGYRGPDNQHYRVEIRDPGDTGTATFVWSRENASVQARWLGQSGNRLTVAIPARDDAAGFTPDSWLELVDERSELTGTPGTMVQVESVDGDVITFRPGSQVPAGATVNFAAMGPGPKVRRWEGPPHATAAAPVPLERGVLVSFEAGTRFRTGDYWSVPARTITADVLWPKVGGTPEFLRPRGPDHRYTKLALLRYDGTAWSVLEDCRAQFPPLTSLVTMRYAGGDGQHAAPNPANPTALVSLPEQLRVAVANGSSPVVGATVQFAVTSGAGRVDAGGGAATSVEAVTDASGVAAVTWQVDSNASPQRVVARLRLSGGVNADVPVTFSATLLRAAGVTVDPSTCTTLAGATNVQEALEQLCAVTRSGCATVVVSPVGDWAAPIRALPTGTAARICFQPGTYRLKEPLVLTGLTSVTVDGAGHGTKIVASTSETALRFVSCGEVVMTDISVTSERATWPGPGDPGQAGVVTAIGCSTVRLERVSLTCAGAVRPSSCCAHISGARGTDVSIRDCTLRVGHLQTGIMVIDGRMVRISDNRIVVAPKGSGLSIDRLLADGTRQRRLVGRLIARPLVSGAPKAPEGLRVGPWLARFPSVAPQAEWVSRVSADPPRASDLVNEEAVRAYIGRLADEAVTNPDNFPAFRRHLASFERSVGSSGFAELVSQPVGLRAVRAQLAGPDIEVMGSAVAAVGRSVTVRLGDHGISFDSPLDARTWNAALRAAGVRSVNSAGQLRSALYNTARRLLVDSALRDKVSGFGPWYGQLVDKNAPAASLGVLCAGRRAVDVSVQGNRFEGVIEAVRVAVSHAAAAGASADVAGRVEVSGNECELALPMEHAHGTQAIFIGNAARVTVEGNSSRHQPAGREKATYDFGVRVHGHLGARLLVAGNVVDNCRTGVGIVAVSGAALTHSWVARDNVAPATTSVVTAPSGVSQSGNVGS